MSAQAAWTCTCGTANQGPGPCGRCLQLPPPGAVDPGRGGEHHQVGAGRRRGRGPAWAVPVLAVLTAVLLLAGTVAGFVVEGDEGAGPARGRAHVLEVRPEGDPAAGGDATPAPEDPEGARAARRVAQLQRFVAEARGLPFTGPVTVTLLPDREFRQRLADQNERDEEDLEDLKRTGRVLTALGLLEADVDLEAALDDLLAGAVAGFYDPEEDELVVRGADLESPSVRITLVHELTHALQDQHFELHRPELDERDDEASLGFTGLVEGDASRIEDQYRASLTAEERKRAEREEVLAAASIDFSLPPILFQLIGFPYRAGPPFVERLAALGQARVDEAFAHPPTTSEQLIHPERFLAGDVGVEVVRPEAGGEVIDEGVLGELGLILLLSRAVPAATAAAAAEGWGGDWYRAWDDGEATCVAARLAMDSPADLDEAVRALGTWAADQPDASVTREPGATLLLHACA